MKRQTDSPQGEGPEVSERLKAERIQESLKAERIQEALVDGGETVFREALLVHAPPDGARTLRQFGRYMYEALLKGDLRKAPPPSLGARVRAVAEDLRFSARVLSELAAARGEAGLLDAAEPQVPAPDRAQVRAVAEDLRFSAQVLSSLATDGGEAERSAEGSALATKAESWARELVELVRTMEGAVTGAKGAP